MPVPQPVGQGGQEDHAKRPECHYAVARQDTLGGSHQLHTCRTPDRADRISVTALPHSTCRRDVSDRPRLTNDSRFYPTVLNQYFQHKNDNDDDYDDGHDDDDNDYDAGVDDVVNNDDDDGDDDDGDDNDDIRPFALKKILRATTECPLACLYSVTSANLVS